MCCLGLVNLAIISLIYQFFMSIYNTHFRFITWYTSLSLLFNWLECTWPKLIRHCRVEYLTMGYTFCVISSIIRGNVSSYQHVNYPSPFFILLSVSSAATGTAQPALSSSSYNSQLNCRNENGGNYLSLTCIHL